MGPDSFRLQGSSAKFDSKLDSVFGGLVELEKQHDDWTKSDAKNGPPCPQKEEPVTLKDNEFSIPKSRTQLDRRGQRSSSHRQSNMRDRRLSDRRRGTEPHSFEGGDSFRRPRGLPPMRRPPKVPDHRVHPEKWTKYSLDSVSETEISDRGNTAAAMSFLKERSEVAKSGTDPDSREISDLASSPRDWDPPVPSAINFRKRFTKKEISSRSEPNKEHSIDDKRDSSQLSAVISTAPCHVMPEHVVGLSKPAMKAARNRPMGPKTGASDRVQLSYLDHNDDEQLPDKESNHDGVSLSENAMETGDSEDKGGTQPTQASTIHKTASVDSQNTDNSDDLKSRPDSAVPLMKKRKFRGNARTRNDSE